jgi:hypothetical protein
MNEDWLKYWREAYSARTAELQELKARLAETDTLIAGILEVTLTRALDALHTAHEGAQRHVPPAGRIYATFISRISRTEDGRGFVGACQELELMTCGETRDEMHRLIVDLVIGYLEAEAKRGNLEPFPREA